MPDLNLNFLSLVVVISNLAAQGKPLLTRNFIHFRGSVASSDTNRMVWNQEFVSVAGACQGGQCKTGSKPIRFAKPYRFIKITEDIQTTVSTSVFDNCAVDILADGTTTPAVATTLYMHCNQFDAPDVEMTLGENAYGLVAGDGVDLGTVNGEFVNSVFIPGTNWFPVDPVLVPDRSIPPTNGVESDWFSPAGWVSLHGDFEYSRYDNEFVGSCTGSAIPTIGGGTVVTGANTFIPSGAVAADCEVSDEWPIVFPARHAVVTSEIDNIRTGLRVYPNPVTNKLWIETDNSDSGKSFCIFDLVGKKVAGGNIDSRKTLIILPTLSKGLYQLRITKEDGSTYGQKIVVTR